ncbi:hypothetical protein LXL04_028149 [Taraxacum kok-saghyz]
MFRKTAARFSDPAHVSHQNRKCEPSPTWKSTIEGNGIPLSSITSTVLTMFFQTPEMEFFAHKATEYSVITRFSTIMTGRLGTIWPNTQHQASFSFPHYRFEPLNPLNG